MISNSRCSFDRKCTYSAPGDKPTAAVISLVVVAWYPLDAKQRTPDVSRLLATSPRWLSQSWADRSGRLGGSARSLPGRDTGTPAAHRRPVLPSLSVVLAVAVTSSVRF